MSAKLTGLNIVLKELESRFGTAKMNAMTDKALKSGARIFVRELKIQLYRFKDTGATIDEVTISKPYTVNGVREIKVYWKGPRNRYRIIHLNEWGTIRKPNPRGKGKIAIALKVSEKKYHDTLKQILVRDL